MTNHSKTEPLEIVASKGLVFQCLVFKPLLTEPLENRTSKPSVSLCSVFQWFSVFKRPLHFLLKFNNLAAACLATCCLDQDRAYCFFLFRSRNTNCCSSKHKMLPKQVWPSSTTSRPAKTGEELFCSVWPEER